MNNIDFAKNKEQIDLSCTYGQKIKWHAMEEKVLTAFYKVVLAYLIFHPSILIWINYLKWIKCPD